MGIDPLLGVALLLFSIIFDVKGTWMKISWFIMHPVRV